MFSNSGHVGNNGVLGMLGAMQQVSYAGNSPPIAHHGGGAPMPGYAQSQFPAYGAPVPYGGGAPVPYGGGAPMPGSQYAQSQFPAAYGAPVPYGAGGPPAGYYAGVAAPPMAAAYPGAYPPAAPAAPTHYPPAPVAAPGTAHGTSATVVAQPMPQHEITDPLFRSKLANIHTYTVEQGNSVLEAATLGIAANTYIVGDASRMIQVQGASPGTMAPTPVFIVREDNSSCCCRTFCEGDQPFMARMFHARDTVSMGKSVCGFYLGHNYQVDQPVPVMTMERQGCCSKCLGCFICASKCENDMFIHLGDTHTPIGATKPTSEYFGRSVLGQSTACFRPSVDLFEGTSKQSRFATAEGPCCCFSGWKGQCCGDVFTLSKERGGKGDIGKIEKLRVRGCTDVCSQSMGNVDRYQLSFASGAEGDRITPEQRAIALAHTIHLDYLFFENDAPLCMAYPVDFETIRLQCSLCTIFIKGCLCPCCCTCDCSPGED